MTNEARWTSQNRRTNQADPMNDDTRALHELARWTSTQLAEGRSRNEIVAMLQGRGISEERARSWVDQVVGDEGAAGRSVSAGSSGGVSRGTSGGASEGMTDARGGAADPSNAAGGGLFGGRFGGLLGLLLVYALINGALYLGQELLSRDDVVRAESIETRLDAMDSELSLLADYLGSKDAESDAIESLARQMEDPEASYEDPAAYEHDLARYDELVDRWNAEVPRVQRAAVQHDSLVAVYNELVDEYNEVAEAAYSRWWLLPIPMPRRGSRGG